MTNLLLLFFLNTLNLFQCVSKYAHIIWTLTILLSHYTHPQYIGYRGYIVRHWQSMMDTNIPRIYKLCQRPIHISDALASIAIRCLSNTISIRYTWFDTNALQCYVMYDTIQVH